MNGPQQIPQDVFLPKMETAKNKKMLFRLNLILFVMPLKESQFSRNCVSLSRLTVRSYSNNVPRYDSPCFFFCFEMATQPTRHECHACCLLRAEKARIQRELDNMHAAFVKRVVSSSASLAENPVS